MKRLRKWLPFKRTARSNGPEQQPPQLARGFLALAVVLLMAHYTFGEWVFHPGLKLWKQWPFWPDLFRYAALPVILWCVWKVISLGKLKVSRIIFMTTVLLCAGDAFFYMIPNISGIRPKITPALFQNPRGKVGLDILLACVDFLDAGRSYRCKSCAPETLAGFV